MSADPAEPEGVIEGWDAIEDADVLPLADEITGAEDLDEIAEDGTSTQIPIAVPSLLQTSKKELEKHNLNHANYRSWCPACVAGRRPNSQH